MPGYREYLRSRFAAAWRESRAEMRGHVPMTIATGVAALILAALSGGAIGGGAAGAVIGAIGGPVLAAIGLYAWKFLAAPYALHQAQAAKSTPAPEDRIEKLLAEQARIAAAKIQPRFDFVLKECGEANQATDCLEIWNHGEEVQFYAIFQYSFMEVTRTDIPYARRFVPAYYFYDRRHTGERAGLLAVLASVSSDMLIQNSKAEVKRLAAEVEAEFGAGSTIIPRLFIEITYTDLAGDQRHADYEVSPNDEAWYYSPDIPRPVGFSLKSYFPLMTVGNQEVLGRLTAKRIRENWNRYLESLDPNQPI